MATGAGGRKRTLSRKPSCGPMTGPEYVPPARRLHEDLPIPTLALPYIEQGDPDGLQLVLIHGLAGLLDDRPHERLGDRRASVLSCVGTAAPGAMVADPQDGLITTPTLISYSERDALVPRSDQDALLEAIPGAELIVNPGGGHAFHWEQPERYAAQLMAFAARL